MSTPASGSSRRLRASCLVQPRGLEALDEHGEQRERAEDVKRGVVSMSHAWGGSSDVDDVVGQGMPTNRLVATHDGFDPITGMAVQSAIPVRVTAAGER